jgi:hypothetical protein
MYLEAFVIKESPLDARAESANISKKYRQAVLFKADVPFPPLAEHDLASSLLCI